MVTVDEYQTITTNAVKKNVNPIWDSSFTLHVRPTSILHIKLFDQKRFKKKGQGFLGLVNISAGSFLEQVRGGAEGEHMELIDAQRFLIFFSHGLYFQNTWR